MPLLGWILIGIALVLILALTGCATHQRAVRNTVDPTSPTAAHATFLVCDYIGDPRNPSQIICPPGYYSQR